MNLERRVRNMETGVHPTGSQFEYYDTVLPTLVVIPDNPYWEGLAQGVHPMPPQWQKRVGQVSLIGGYKTKVGVDALTVPNDVVVGLLPEEARPLQQIIGWVTYYQAPYLGRVTIETDGSIKVAAPSSTFTVSFLEFRLESIGYTAN